jgi:hypothetical protein
LISAASVESESLESPMVMTCEAPPTVSTRVPPAARVSLAAIEVL